MFEAPKIHIKKTKMEWFHDILCICLFVGILLYLAYMWPTLPDRIPIHYDLQEHADRWGSKWFILLLILLNVLIYLGFTFIRKYPHKFNYPSRLTKENAENFYRNANLTISWVKLETVIYFSVLGKNFIDSAANKSDFMNVYGFLVWICALVITVVYFLVKRRRIK